MKCPKCGFVSHDYLDACRKCSIDLAHFKTQMNLRVVQPGDIDLMATLEGAAVGLKAKVAESFSSQMLVETDESWNESKDNFDISLDNDFSALDSDQLDFSPAEESASAGSDISFDLSAESDTAPAENDLSLPPPTTGYATVMIDINALEGMFDDNKKDSATTAQDDEPPATSQELSSDLLLDAADAIGPNSAMLDLEGLNEATFTSDLDDTHNADPTVLDVDDVATAFEAEPINSSRDISLPHTVETTMVLDNLDAFEPPAAIDSLDVSAAADTIVDAEIPDLDIPDLDIPDLDIPDMDMPEISAIETLTPSRASFISTEIDLEPDEASAANPTVALKVSETPSPTDLDLSDLDFDLEPDLLHFDSQEADDLEVSFMNAEDSQPPMPQAHDTDEMPLDLDDLDFEDDEQSST